MTRPAQILLVDDEVAIQRAMAPLLRSRGYAVTLAGDRRARRSTRSSASAPTW